MHPKNRLPDASSGSAPRGRVLHIVSNRWFSAITDYALTAAAALNSLHSAGEEQPQQAANLVLLPESSAALDHAAKLGLHVLTFKSFSLRALRPLFRLIRDYQPTAIICYEGPETALTRLLAPWLNDVAIYRFYGRDLRLLKFPPRPWLRLSTAHLRGVIVPSKAVADIVEPYFPGRCQQITLGRRLALSQEKTTPSDGPPRLLMLGRLDPVKGHREFVVMFKAMLERWQQGEPLPTLTIIGEPKNITEQNLRQWLRHYGVADQVSFDSTRSKDIAKLLASYDAGIIYSQGSEVICRVGAEMLMAGLGIIVTDVGALAELNLRANASDVLVVPSIDTDEHTVTLDAMIAFAKAAASETPQERLQRQKFYHRAFGYELMATRLARLLFNPQQPTSA